MKQVQQTANQDHNKVRQPSSERSPERRNLQRQAPVLARLASGRSFDDQVTQLSDDRLAKAEKYALARGIGLIRGNHYLQRVFAALQSETNSREAAQHPSVMEAGDLVTTDSQLARLVAPEPTGARQTKPARVRLSSGPRITATQVGALSDQATIQRQAPPDATPTIPVG